MIDEDAFGMLFSYYDVEDDEYGLAERADFVRRFQAFELAVLEVVQNMTLPEEHHVLCLGHAVYVEFPDLDDLPQLLNQFRSAGARIHNDGFTNVSVLSHGSRWIEEGAGAELSLTGQSPRIARISRPSEPLRRALHVEALARREDDDTSGWGPGVYVDTEALEALGKTPKNAPTVLRACGAEFFRIPALEAR
jgi:hypothetical protein